MKVENRVFPNREQMKGFFENTDDNEPIYMLNLLKFKEKAEYRDGRETNLTGREAYTIYAEFMGKHLEEIGTIVHLTKKDYLPLIISGSENLLPIKHNILKAPAQIKSALIIAALNIHGKTKIVENIATRDHTERLLKFLNIKFKIKKIKK